MKYGQGAAVGEPVALPGTVVGPCCDAARRLAEFAEWLDVMLGAALLAHHEPAHTWEGDGRSYLQATRDEGRRQGVVDALRTAWATLHDQEYSQSQPFSDGGSP